MGGERHRQYLATAVGRKRSGLANQCVAVFSWHLDVRHEQVRPPALQDFEGIRGRPGGHDVSSAGLQHRRHHVARISFIVDDQNSHTLQ